MKLEINIGPSLAFIRKNWFKLSLAILGFYLLFIKQLSFQIQVHAPENTQQQHQVKRKSIEKITENNIADGTMHKDKIERLEIEIPLLGSMGNGRNTIAELKTINENTKHAYLERFLEVAKSEQSKFGIPASVILGAAMLQSTAGTRDLAVQANNHFGLPCSPDWRSACQSFHGRSYRKYESAWSSFRDFSNYLDTNFANLKGGNYENYANAFQNEGLGEDAKFGEHLVQIIEGYRLHQLDGN